MFPERKTNNKKDSVTKVWMIFVQSWQLRRVSNVNVNVTLFKGFYDDLEHVLCTGSSLLTAKARYLSK